ncbi:MAG: hypothetical protein NC302_06190 [Bacteroidales bacterium]|nr:hypothetical protein [Bacteroidales bacterium]MCM1415876.1 hypothetical protein [bacterium]
MRKKIVILTLMAALSVSVLVGCGGGSAEPAGSDSVASDEADVGETAESTEPEAECEHEWADATCTAPKTCSKCGATEGEALGHTWVDATFAAPKTCSVCGETEGTVKQSYFEEHGVEVADAPVACTVDALIFNPDNPETYQKATDCVWEQLDCYSEPAEEEGYQLIYLELLATHQTYYDAAQDVSYHQGRMGASIYDWYTGQKLPARSMEGNDAFEISVPLEVDGVSYDVSNSLETQWEGSEWVYDDDGNGTYTWKAYFTYSFKVPDGYDGLVFAAVSAREYDELDTETIDESVVYACDEGKYIEGTKFFRINKEGMVSEKLPEDSADTTAE